MQLKLHLAEPRARAQQLRSALLSVEQTCTQLGRTSLEPGCVRSCHVQLARRGISEQCGAGIRGGAHVRKSTGDHAILRREARAIGVELIGSAPPRRERRLLRALPAEFAQQCQAGARFQAQLVRASLDWQGP